MQVGEAGWSLTDSPLHPTPLLYLSNEDANVSSFGVLASKEGEPGVLRSLHHMELDYFALLQAQTWIQNAVCRQIAQLETHVFIPYAQHTLNTGFFIPRWAASSTVVASRLWSDPLDPREGV